MSKLRLASLFTCLAGAVLYAVPSLADDAPTPASDFTITGSAGVWSQYRFRGIAQSDNKPVFQDSLTLTHKSGFYLSTWGSSAAANDAVDIGGTEIDVYSHGFSVIGTNVWRSDMRPFDPAADTDDFHRIAKTVLVGSVSASF